ncbi:radical SAM peptide maturase, partial [Bacteroides fragilis]
MKNNVTFSTANYDYLYSCNHKECIPLHPILRRIIKLDEDGCLGSVPNDPELNGYSPEMIAYYLRKYDYLKARGIIASKDNVEFASLTASSIQKELENLSVLTFEVTDRCNLRCRYCAYGDLYEGYDERKGQDMDFGVAQKMLEYLYSIWGNANPLSSVRTVAIGFYGGEPLMNFELIRQVVEYTSRHPLPGIAFKYNMTTNAMLLNKYQDFLQMYDVKLLISLDGTKEDDCHRITINGKPSFEHVYRQVKTLQQTYPDYFQHSVVFNSVIHSKSNIERILDFFEKEFGRQTMFSELSN